MIRRVFASERLDRTRLEEDNREILPPVAGPVSNQKANVIEGFKVAGRFAQTLIKKVPECVTTNPVQMAFSIAKVIIEMKDVGYRLVSWALIDYYIRKLEATKTSLYNFSKTRQTDS